MDEQPVEQKVVVEHDGARMEVPYPDPSSNTILYINATIKALRSEMRVWFIAAIAGNQILAHVALQGVTGYIGGVAVVGAAFGIKVLSSFR